MMPLLQLMMVGIVSWLPIHQPPTLANRFLDQAGLSSAVLGPHQAAPSVDPAKLPADVAQQPAPTLSASGVLAIDDTSQATLTSKNADSAVPIASVTKLATALVILARHNPNEVVTIPQLPTYQSEDEIVGLKPGQRYAIKDLLAALLIGSANDAADSLAIIDAGSQQAFAVRMNESMKTWGIPNAQFNNPSGLVDAGNSASPRALVKISQLLLHNQLFTQLINTQQSSIQTVDGGSTINLTTTDKLLSTGQFSGIKTGYTLAAGQCFIGLTSVAGHPVITVVLGSVDRFGDTLTLRNWIEQTYQWPNSR